MKRKFLYALTILFFIALMSFFIIQQDYIKKSQTNYTNTIKQEITLLIDTKKHSTFDIAKNISINKKLIKIIETNNYEVLYKDPHFFPIYNNYKNFKNIGIHIIDKNGIQKYLSWTKKSLGKNILYARPDLAKILKTKKPSSNISSGLFDITFKGIVPILDKNKNILGIIEVITHFNSIVNQLKKQHIYSAVILTKQKSNHIKFAKYGNFIENYFISNKINEKIKPYLSRNLDNFINIDKNKFKYIENNNDLFDGYFVVNIPIINKGQHLGYFVAFIEDNYKLREKELSLNFIMFIITVLFIFTGYIAFINGKKNEELIKSLNVKIEDEISEKLQLIYTDTLTKAFKKTKFDIDRTQHINENVVILNIRNFSKINELYGFKIGDEVLKIVTQRIEHILEKKLYRINADEFVFFSKNPQNDVENIKIIFRTNSIALVKSIKVRLSFSFGVTNNEGTEILKKLSIALKEAKKQPFKNLVFYKEQKINDDFIKFNTLLYDALFTQEKASILPYFQGIRDNSTNKIVKYECLARLKTDKIYSPFFFIDIAKNSGFLFEITRIMIDKSFHYLSTKPKNIEISINITEDDLLTYQLKNYLLKKLEKYNLTANRITLEILEGITSSGTNNNISQLKELKELGFKLAIDDFGVEYSNFERISELDIDFIKIDGKYIKNLDTSEKSYKIAKAITDFAHSLNIKVVAEFVENDKIQKIIEDLKIDYSQGYCFSKPDKEML